MAGRVLIVEDDPGNRQALARLLSHLHYEVTAASSLAEARTQLQLRPDFVLLDLQLMDGSGMDLLRDIRTADSKPLVAVITGCEQQFAALGENDLLPDAVFLKPILAAELIRWLHNGNGSAAEAAGAADTLGDPSAAGREVKT